MSEPSPGARTEEATPRRLAEARRRGQVAVSRELTGALTMAAVFAVLAVGAASGVGQLISYFRAALAWATTGVPAAGALATGVRAGAAVLILPLGIALAVTVTAGLAQTGGVFTFAPVRFDLRRARPRLARVLGVAALADATKGLVVVLLLAAVAWLTLAAKARGVATLVGATATEVLAALGTTTEAVGWRLVAATLALGAADRLWQRRRHRRALRMTRDEVERERKEHEGDPRHKAERQRLHRALLAQRTPSDVRQADFVVVDGSEVAIALVYERARGSTAPVILVKGERLAAARMNELARAAGVPIFGDGTLAQALRALDEGAEIPETLYEPVAEIVRALSTEQR